MICWPVLVAGAVHPFPLMAGDRYEPAMLLSEMTGVILYGH